MPLGRWNSGDHLRFMLSRAQSANPVKLPGTSAFAAAIILLAVRAEVRARLEVLERLADLSGAGKAVVVLGSNLHYLEVVPELIQRADEVVPRIHAATHPEVASIRHLVARAHPGAHPPPHIAHAPPLAHPR